MLSKTRHAAARAVGVKERVKARRHLRIDGLYTRGTVDVRYGGEARGRSSSEELTGLYEGSVPHRTSTGDSKDNSQPR